MTYLYLVLMIALLQFALFTARVGANRNKYGVKAPATTGDETWERLYRVQMNTMEQLVMFIPASLAFAHFVSATWVLIPAVLFVIGRQLYSMAYINRPDKRAPGMVLTFLSNFVLIAGAIIGLLLQLFRA